MTTHGFTAEASLNWGIGHHPRARWVSSDAGERLGMAQLGLPALPFPVQPVQLVPASPISGQIYGNWCGEGYGSGIPWDKVDQVCCRHDKCYCTRGDLDCSCDRDLLADMPGAIADPDTPPLGRAAGALIMDIFASWPFCLCHRICHPSFPDFWNLDCSRAPFPVPGLPPLKICQFPYA